MASAALVGCGGDGADAPGARIPGVPQGEGFYVVNHVSRPSETWSYAAIPLCVEGKGAVVLDDVRPRVTGPLRLVGAAVRPPSAPQLTTGLEPLPASYPALAGYRLSAPCAEGNIPEIVLRVERAGSGSAALLDFGVGYHDDRGRHRASRYAVTIVLCDGNKQAQVRATVPPCGQA